MSERRLSAVDLFAGCGGLSLGLRNAGFKVAAAIEIDETASQTYKKNHPNTKLLTEDVQNVTAESLTRSVPRGGVSLLAACAPCQGFCSLTAKWGREDVRNELVLEVGRFVKELQPEAVFMENVPGLETRGQRLLTELLATLKAEGYYAQVRVIQMANHGIPQNRRRLVLLAGKGFVIPFPEATHHRDPAPDSGLKSWMTVRQAIQGNKAPLRLSAAHKLGGPQRVNWHVVRDLHEKTRKRLKAALPGKSWLDIDESLRPDCHQNGYSGFTNVYGRMAWDTIAGTITSGCTTPCKGRVGHPDRRRTTLSVREAATLQTFPKSYRFDTEKMEAVCEMIGNAVPPKFAEVIGLQIAMSLRQHLSAISRI
ncbi:MAG: DNA cytosine methyltransferase [Acidobacteriota bacterium]